MSFISRLPPEPLTAKASPTVVVGAWVSAITRSWVMVKVLLPSFFSAKSTIFSKGSTLKDSLMLTLSASFATVKPLSLAVTVTGSASTVQFK